MTNRLDIAVVREAARGHWDAIFWALAPAFKLAMQRPGRHVPCPVHGGKDGFRLFPDFQEAGSCVCNTCGTFRDGFAALAWLHGWGFAEALYNVARVLGLCPRRGERLRGREAVNRVFRGTVLNLGEADDVPKRCEGFCVTIEDEESDHAVLNPGTQSLRAALAKADVHALDRVEITLCSRE